MYANFITKYFLNAKCTNKEELYLTVNRFDKVGLLLHMSM